VKRVVKRLLSSPTVKRVLWEALGLFALHISLNVTHIWETEHTANSETGKKAGFGARLVVPDSPTNREKERQRDSREPKEERITVMRGSREPKEERITVNRGSREP